MAHLLVELLAACDKSSIVGIVIDRLDRCNWANDQHDDAEALRMAVGSLLDLSSHPALSHLKLRTLLVMDEGPARHITREIQSWKGFGFEWHIDWHQEAEDDFDEWVEEERESRENVSYRGHDATIAGLTMEGRGIWGTSAATLTGLWSSQSVVSTTVGFSVSDSEFYAVL
jgi:hypothetical protein